MINEDYLYTHHFPKNPLPFNIVDESCGICKQALHDLNEYLPNFMVGDEVRLTLQKDSAGRGWHIKFWQINDYEPHDLSDVTVQKEE